MKYFKKLAGRRVYLSPINMDDLQQYTQWLNDPVVAGNIGAAANVFTLPRERAALEDMTKDGHNFAIVTLDGDRLLGNTGLFDVNHLRRTANCGIFIGDADARGQGYGGEAMRLLLKYGFETLNLNNVMLDAFEFNVGAIKCYENVGFKHIGRRRQSYFLNGRYYDQVIMDILPGDLL
ncbi:hypothetical protein FACS1894217_08540 [Clostridia bacterium]|nr:hypothetical protein FACS1894217_08540 [Clostridia bacterium]